MKLVLYSGGHEDENFELDSALIKLTHIRRPKITYIPSCYYGSEEYYEEFVRHYQGFNITKFYYFPIDIPYSDVLLEEAFKSHIIHLSGGNTYYFLKNLRRKKLLRRLREFVQKGGILTGLSAGAILMCPTIHTAGFPSFDRDENEENIKNLNALKLVNFDFFPHYKNSNRYDLALKDYTEKTKIPLYAMPDGSGIIIDRNFLKFSGRSYCFFRGQKMPIKGLRQNLQFL